MQTVSYVLWVHNREKISPHLGPASALSRPRRPCGGAGSGRLFTFSPSRRGRGGGIKAPPFPVRGAGGAGARGQGGGASRGFFLPTPFSKKSPAIPATPRPAPGGSRAA